MIPPALRNGLVEVQRRWNSFREHLHVHDYLTLQGPDPNTRSRPSSLIEGGQQGEVVRVPAVQGAPDPRVIEDLEREARRLATEVDSLVENLSCTLQGVSALTVDTVETYRDGVCKTCDEVDNNIKAMYQLMAKWEELNKNMAPAYRVANQIKDIKRLLEMFEAALG